MRVAPGVASQPDRIAKDLENSRRLAAKLEDEADALARTSADDTFMSDASEMTKDRGTVAVDNRIKMLWETLEEKFAGSDEEKVNAKKVSDIPSG